MVWGGGGGAVWFEGVRCGLGRCGVVVRCGWYGLRGCGVVVR